MRDSNSKLHEPMLNEQQTAELGTQLLIILDAESPERFHRRALKIITKFRPFLPRKAQGLLREIHSSNEFRFFPKRAIAANFLGRIQYRAAIPKLFAVTKDRGEEPFIRGAAIEALGELNANEAVPTLISIIQAHDPNRPARLNVYPFLGNLEPSRVVSAAAISLGWIGDIHAIEPLLFLLDSQVMEVRMSAIESLHYFDTYELNLTLFRRYLSIENGTNLKSAIAELLVDRNLVPLIKEIGEPGFIALETLILRQDPAVIGHLAHARDRTPNPSIQAFIDRLMAILQPVIKISPGLEILL